MKFQMHSNSLFAILMRKPWWISLLIGLAFCALAWAMLPQQYVLVGAAGSLPFFIIAAKFLLDATVKKVMGGDVLATILILDGLAADGWSNRCGALDSCDFLD